MNRIFTFFLILNFHSICFGMENISYVLHNNTTTHLSAPKTLVSLTDHTKSINLLISQAYQIDQNGVVTGFINSDILRFTESHSLKLMAMVTNRRFDPETTHRFLSNPNAQQLALKTLVDLCLKHHLYGIQFDFEMVPIPDKNALTHFYQNAVNLLHQNGLRVSFAVPPVVSDGPFESSYQKRLYDKFGGAYDLKTLGKFGDFITIMAYDQHIGRVTPGPIASTTWVEQIIKHALKYIPREKISLGIPAYSGHWYTGMKSKKITMQNETLSHENVVRLLNNHHASLQWDNLKKVNYAIYEHNWLNEYIFIENARSFKMKLALVKKYKLRGISFFRIGIEDPKIWNEL